MANSVLYNRFFDSSMFRGGARKGMKGIISLMEQKKEFLLLVFANLIVQLGITYYTFIKTPSGQITAMQRFGIMVSLFVFIFALIFPMPSWIKFIVFSLFSVLQGLFLSSIKSKINENVIQLAMSGTISIFVFLFAFSLALMGAGVYLNNSFGVFLFWALLFLFIFQIISVFAGTMSIMMKGFSFIGFIIFSLYVVYDTQNILNRNYYGDFITASLDYYLDILNIFLDIVTLNNN